ncbi:MAG: TatD family hydrolase, partial [bacterium]|nr:TatD family hydrolase [Candidatus Kapabacteria bacterium]
MIDTHSHIYAEQFDEDRDAIVERAREAGVENIIVPATKPEEFDAVIALAERYPDVRGAFGVHPHHAAQVNDADLQRVSDLATMGRGIAVGEIGLDYYYDFAPRERQHEVFRHQLRIARETGIPAVLHNRESDDDLLEILEQEQDGTLAFQLHCFSSSVEVLHRALELGAMISFTGNVTFVKANLDEVVRLVPDERIMIETDAPYLAPVPYRGRRNEPSYVGLVADRIATIRGQTPDRIRQMTTENARRFFRLLIVAMFLLTASSIVVEAQTRRERVPDTTLAFPVPVRDIDTNPKAFTRIFGIGPHLGSSTYISGATTLGSGFAYGFWAT